MKIQLLFTDNFIKISLTLISISCGSAPETVPPTPGRFSFAALGDAPYHGDDHLRFDRLIEKLNADELTWVLHVGDILWYPCSDELFESRHQLFQRFRFPFILTPGDNDWTDCHEEKRGGTEGGVMGCDNCQNI